MKKRIVLGMVILALAGCKGNSEISISDNKITAVKNEQVAATIDDFSESDKADNSEEDIAVPEEHESSRALSKQEFMDMKFSRACGWDGSVIALTSDGNIVTWGNNVRGKIGNGERGGYTEDGYSVPVSPFYIDLEDDIVDIETSENDSFALTRLGEVYAWGSNSFGELGINSGFILKPEKLDIDEFVVKVAPSNATNLFLTNDGQVLLSGLDILKYKSLPERNENIAYEYNPEISEEPSAVIIAEAGYKKLELPFNCRDISIGVLHYAFLSEDREVYVEGTLIGDYELSKPDLTHDKLTKVDFPEKITEIESGSGFIAALSETGKVYLYGTRESVFFNEEYDAQLSENVFLKGGVVGVSSIDCDMYCVVLTDENNDAYGFGIDRWGVFGKESDSKYEIISTPIFLRNNVKECGTDTLNSIFVSEDGKISMYGANGFKQISFLNGDFN